MLINENWKIESDDLNVMLFQRRIRQKDNEEYWRVHSYYPSISLALKGLIQLGIMGTGMKDLETINTKIGELEETLSRLL